MKKNNKTNRKSTRTSMRNSSQKLFRNGAQGFEALEPRQMLDAGLSNALFDTPIPYTESQEVSTTFLSVTPSSDTLESGSVYAGIRVYGMDSNGIRQTTENYSISAIEKVNADGSKTPIAILEQGQGLQGTYSFACAEMLLGQEYSITVTWNGEAATAPNFGAIAYLLGDTNAFEVSTELPAKDAKTNEYIANQQNNVAECEVTLVKAAMTLDDPQTNWQHQQGTNLLNQSGFSSNYMEMFSLDTNALWENSDLARVQTNQKAGTVNFHLTFDQEAPALSVDVRNADGDFAGTAIVSEGSKTGKVQSFTVNVNTSTDSPILNMTFTDAKSNIASIEYSVDGTSYTKLEITGEKKTESFSFDWVSKVGSKLTEGTTSNIYVKTADVIGNTGAYTFNVSYTASVEYTVGENAKTSLEGGKTVEGKDNILFTNKADGSTIVNVNPDFTFTEGATTSQRVGVKFGDTIYYANYQDFSSTASTASLKLTDFDGLLEAMGATEGTIPDGTYTLTAFIQDSFGHDAQQVGVAQTLVIDTVAPVIDTVSVAGDTSGETSIADKTTADVIVTLSNADATDIKVVVALDSSTVASQEGTITAGDLKSSTITLNKGAEYKYGKNDFTVTLTDAAGNVTTQTFTLWYNTTPTADQLEVSAKEWGEFNTGYSDKQYAALDFASKVDDSGETETKNLTINVNASTVVNGSLYKLEDGTYTKLEAEEGFYTFKATEAIYYLADEYWFGTETMKYTVTDDANTPATSTENNVIVTVEAVDTQVVVDWTAPTAVDENVDNTSTAVEQIIGTFTYPDNEPRDWSAVWTKGTTDAHIYNDKSDEDKTTLFTTEPVFTVVAGDTDAVGMTTYSIVMKDWALAQYLWGTQDFTVTVKGKMGEKSTADTETTSDTLTFTVNAIDQLPQAGSTKQFNVSLSTLSKGDITLTLDDTMFSDIDDTYDTLEIPSVTLKCGDGLVVLTTADPTKTLDVNGVSVEFTLDGKTIVISENDSKDLDKESIEVSFTVEDSYKETATVSGSTIKFSAYASDDEVETVQKTTSYSFNVLKNDYDNSDKWDGKTFTITGINNASVTEGQTIQLDEGALTLVDAENYDGTTGNFTFVPKADYRGTFTFTYTITNTADSTETAQATVTVIVAALNTAPTANAISSNGDEWGEQDKDHTAQTYIKVNFGDAIGDNAEETAQTDLVIAMTGTGISDNGTWYYLKDGEYTQITDLSNVQLKNGDVYFSPKNYWNGTLNVAYTVTDAITGWVNSSLKVASGQTALTASNSIVIIVANQKTSPVISEQADKTIDESGSATTGTANVAKATMPTDSVNEAVATVTAVSKSMTAHQLNDGTDSLTALLTDVKFNIGSDGQITCDYTQIANVYGTQTFTVTVKSDLGGETSFDWTITVNAVNTAPSITANTDKFELTEGKYVLKEHLTEVKTDQEDFTEICLGDVNDYDNVLDSLDIKVTTVDDGHILNNNTDTKQSLFADSDFVIRDGKLYFQYKLAAHLHGTAEITVTLNDKESVVTPKELDSNVVTYTIVADSVNDTPETGTKKDFNVSLSTLAKGNVTLTFDNTMYSDIDDEFDTLTVTNATLTSSAGSITLAQGESSTLEVNGVNVRFMLSGKTIVVTTNTEKDLDGGSVDVSLKIEDAATASCNASATIKFNAYATDDNVETVQDTASYSFNVLKNDYDNSEGWDGKTFTITSFDAIPETTGTLTLIDAGSIEGNNFTFVPAEGYRGTFTFTYTITNKDDEFDTASATVTVVVDALNTKPTAEEVEASGDEWGTQDKGHTAQQYIPVNFTDAIGDNADETAKTDLVISFADGKYADNGTWYYLKDGVYTQITDFSNIKLSNGDVYFSPKEYWNGTVNVSYTVTDAVTNWVNKDLKVQKDETAKSASSTVVIIVNNMATDPVISDKEDYTVNESKTDASGSVNVAVAKLPAGAVNETIFISATSKSKEAHQLNDNLDTLDNLLKSSDFVIDENGQITCTYTQLAHIYGTQTFTITVKTNKGGETAFDWTFTVNSVNDVPTTEGVAEQGTITGTTGTWSKTTDQLKALILAKSDDIDDNLTDANITIATTGLPTGMTYDQTADTYSLTTTALSNTFEISYTINDKHAGTVDGKITVSFDQAPYIENYQGFKNVDATEAEQSGSWLLFNLSDVKDAEGETYTADNIKLSNAYWNEAKTSVYMDYNFAKGAFGSNVATVTITDADNEAITSTYTFTAVSKGAVSMSLKGDGTTKGQTDVTDDNPLNYNFKSGLLETPDSAGTLNLKELFNTYSDEYTYEVSYNFDGGKDYQATNDDGQPMFWAIEPEGNVTTEQNSYPVYEYNELGISVPLTDENGNQLYWAVAPSSSNTIAQTGDTRPSDYAEMIKPSSKDAVPVVATVNSDDTLALNVSKYSGSQACSGTMTITRNDGETVTIDITITPEITYNLQWFVTDSSGNNTLHQDDYLFINKEDWKGTVAEYYNNDIAYNQKHYLEFYASDELLENLDTETYDEDFVFCFQVDIDFGAPVQTTGKKPYGSEGFVQIYNWNADKSKLTIFYMTDSANYANNEQYALLANFYYSYAEDTDAYIKSVTITGATRYAGIQASNKTLNTLQIEADWAEGTDPTPAIFGTEEAEKTVVEGTGLYMQLTKEQPTVQTSETLPESESWIHEWQSHYVNVYANTQDATIIDGRVMFELNYDPQYFTATDFVAGDALLNGKYQLETVEGKVYITGLADQLLANDGFVLLGSVKFESLDENGIAANTVGSVDMGLTLSNIVLYDENGDQIDVNTQTVVDTRLWANVYDSNDDGEISSNDFINFAKYYGTDTVSSNDALAWALDFNKSGKIDSTDFVSFAQNYGSTRENGKEVLFSDAFVQEYIGVKLDGEGDTSLRELVEQAVDEWEAKLDTELDVNIQLKVVDLNGKQLGASYIVDLAEDGIPATGVITLDSDAAGYRWSISEDDTILNGSASEMYDLYTVILHEVGHLLGYTEQYSAFEEVTKDNETIDGSHTTDESDLMYRTINRGERKSVSDADAQILSDAYDYALANGAELNFTSAESNGEAIYAAETADSNTVATEIASGIVDQEQWTKTLETKVYEELDRIVTENRNNVFAVEDDEEDEPILDDFVTVDFTFDVASKADSEEDSLFDDLSWIDGDSAENTELEVELKEEI